MDKQNVLTILNNGMDEQRKAHTENDGNYTGNIRGGSVGVIWDDRVVGHCHRVALLRMLGINKRPADNNTQIMFDAGLSAEQHIATLIRSAGYKTLQESEIPVLYEMEGKTVSGRPDIVIVADDGTKTGLEIKTVCSTFTAEAVGVKGEPKLEHLTQAAHYSHRLDIPYILLYWNPNVFVPTYFLKKTHPDVHKIPPFIKMYEMAWRDDVLFVDGKQTIITKSGIDGFVRLVTLMEKHKSIGDKFSSYTYVGKKMTYSLCTYCEFQHVCKQTNDYDEFVHLSKLITSEG
jgi:hypothetical protein